MTEPDTVTLKFNSNTPESAELTSSSPVSVMCECSCQMEKSGEEEYV